MAAAASGGRIVGGGMGWHVRWRPDPGPLVACFVGLALVVVTAVRLRRMWVAVSVAVVFSATVMVTGLQAWDRHNSPVAALAAQEPIATIEFRLLAEPQVRPQATVARGELVWVEARARRVEARVPLLVVGSGERGDALRFLVAGATYRAKVRLGAPEPDDSVTAIARLRAVEAEMSTPGLLDRGANAMRQGLRDAVAHSPPAQAALVPSLVVGDTSAVSDTMAEQFRATGLTHLMAVSGANLSLMLGVVLAAARGAGLRGWSVRLAAVAGVAGFVIVCGQEPSVLRAAAMGLVALAAIGVGTGKRSVRALCVAILALVWVDPWLARSVGFALSVSACAGIVLLGPRMVSAMASWAPRWAAEALAIPLAAQLATQPLVTGISDQVSVVGVVTNALAGPFVGPTTVLGLAAALLTPVPFLAAGPGWLAGWCAQPIIWLATAGAALPSAVWDWDATPIGIGLVIAAVAALAVVLPVLLKHWSGGVLFLLLLVAASLVRPVPLGWPGDWQAAFCDVGQGDATVLRAGPGAAVLVDAGPEPGPALACLGSLGVTRIPMLVLTHYHADHVGGADAVIARYRPQLILVRAGPPPPWLTKAAEAAGSIIRSANTGDDITVGTVTWRTVSVWNPVGAAVPEGDGEGSAENDASVVAVADIDGLRVLLAGDLEPLGQGIALRASHESGLSLRAQILKLPHHGSARQEPRFLAATEASLAVASAGEGNSYGHPAASTLSLVRSLGITIARTDEVGSIAVGLEGQTLVVHHSE